MRLHADAVRTLGSWAAPDEGQERLRAAYLEHLEAHPDAMRRTCLPDHLTASTLVVSADHSRVLLTLHRKLGRWLQTGGHCEAGDATLVAAASREGTEESGIAALDLDPEPVRLDRHTLRCGAVFPASHLDVQFVAVSPVEAQEVISEESLELRWFATSDLPESTDDSVRLLVRAALDRLSTRTPAARG